jgi:type VI secretion system protein ImpB
MPELPFVVGVLGNFSGQPAEPLPQLRDRRFIEINPDNFDEILKSMKPRLSLTVENRLQERKTDEGKADAGQLTEVLQFESLEDFEPHRIAEKVSYLKDIVDLRTRLNDLKANMAGRIAFEEMLETTIRDEATRTRLRDEIKKFKEGRPK